MLVNGNEDKLAPELGDNNHQEKKSVLMVIDEFKDFSPEVKVMLSKVMTANLNMPDRTEKKIEFLR